MFINLKKCLFFFINCSKLQTISSFFKKLTNSKLLFFKNVLQYLVCTFQKLFKSSKNVPVFNFFFSQIPKYHDLKKMLTNLKNVLLFEEKKSDLQKLFTDAKKCLPFQILF